MSPLPQLPTAVGCTEILAQALEHLRKAEIFAGMASTAAGHEEPAISRIDCILADAEEAYSEISAALELIEIYIMRCVSS